MKVKEESEKTGLKLNIQKTKIMALSPITSQQIGEETMETVRDFIFLVSKITAGGYYSYEFKRCLFLGRKAMCEYKTNHLSQKKRIGCYVGQSIRGVRDLEIIWI